MAAFANLARAFEQGQRCLLLAREGTAESIREKIEDSPALMRSTGETRISRLYHRKRKAKWWLVGMSDADPADREE